LDAQVRLFGLQGAKLLPDRLLRHRATGHLLPELRRGDCSGTVLRQQRTRLSLRLISGLTCIHGSDIRGIGELSARFDLRTQSILGLSLSDCVVRDEDAGPGAQSTAG
jgi:hypothetical protein